MMVFPSRHDALNRLGIKQWYVKYTLPNVPESPIFKSPKLELFQCSHDDLASNSSGVQTLNLDNLTRASLSNEVTVKGHDVELLIENLFPRQSEAREARSVTSSNVVAEIDDAFVKVGVTLSLSFVQFGQYLVLYEFDGADDIGPENLLLDAIIQFFGVAGGVSKRECLSWPIFQSEALFKGQSLFFESVFRRWLERESWSECTYLFYFGKHFDYLEEMLCSLKGIRESRCVLLPFRFSLAQVLASPMKKKKLWELFSGVGGVGG